MTYRTRNRKASLAVLKLRGFLIILLLTGILTPGGAQAQNVSQALWQVSYWNNTTLSGPPVLRRDEASIDYNWGADSPHPSVNEDNFSARWTSYISFRPGTYRFNATSDDGIRVWIDGDMIIDEWYDHPVQTFTADKSLGTGPHHIVVEYYEHLSGAIAQLWWAPASPPDGVTWQGEYYDNTNLSNDPVVVRQDPAIGFNWTTVSPAPGVPPDEFSVRWTRSVKLEAGSYRFAMTVDDGGRLWVNGRLLIDAWEVQSPRTYTGEIYLPGGATPIKMEYFDNQLGAVAQLSWSRASTRAGSWHGEYYDNRGFRGAPALVRDVPEIDFDWGLSSPAPDQIGVDRFAIRWTRTLDLAAGRYRFTMRVDDGGRLWIDDRMLIDAWKVQSPHTYSADVDLSGDSVTVRMEYFEDAGGSVARLAWSPLSPSAPASRDWRNVIPVRWHPVFQRCLEHWERTDRELGSAPNWEALLEECKILSVSDR